MKRIVLLLAAAGIVCAQGITTGSTAPDPGLCNSVSVGSIYVRSGNAANAPVGTFRCTQTAPAAFGWHPVDHLVLATLPAKCADGDLGYQTGGTTGLYTCASNTWTLGSATGTTLAGDASGPSAANVVTWYSVAVLPPATGGTVGRPYLWTGATTSGNCPVAGAGGSGGSAKAGCVTVDGTAWSSIAIPVVNGLSGSSACWKGTTLSYCTSVVASDGTCTCH